MEPTRTPLGRVVTSRSGTRSDSGGTLGGTRDGRSGPMRRLGEMAHGLCEDDDDDDDEPLALAAMTSEALVRVINGGSCRSGNSFEVYFTPPFGFGGEDDDGSEGGTAADCCARTAKERGAVAVVVVVVVVE